MPQLLKPEVLARSRLAFGEDDGVVLVQSEKALAAAGRSEDQESVGARDAARSLLSKLLLSKRTGATGERAELPRHDARNVACAHALGEKALGHGRDLRPSPSERGNVPRLVYIVAEDDGGIGSQAAGDRGRTRPP